MKSQLVLKQIRRLEKQFCVTQEINEKAAEIQELLRKQEELLESLRRDPEYSVEWEMKLIEDVVQDLIKEGLLQNAAPLNVEPNENGEGGE
jgi:hypothetical protein